MEIFLPVIQMVFLHQVQLYLMDCQFQQLDLEPLSGTLDIAELDNLTSAEVAKKLAEELRTPVLL